MARLALLVALVACNSNTYRTHAFTAATSCGQGPYDVHIAADGTTAEDGLEVVACTPRRLAGHIEMSLGKMSIANREFGDGSADNQRCIGGPAVVSQLGSASPSAAAASGGGSATANEPVLVEQAFTGDETAWGDELCKPYGVAAQTLLIPTTMTRTTGWNFIEHGTDLHVRIWSDVPNDLSGVTFLVREVMSKDKPQPPKPVKPDQEPHGTPAVASASSPPPPPSHGAPPAPLAEAKPARTSEGATWVPGYWQWTGSQWGVDRRVLARSCRHAGAARRGARRRARSRRGVDRRHVAALRRRLDLDRRPLAALTLSGSSCCDRSRRHVASIARALATG